MHEEEDAAEGCRRFSASARRFQKSAWCSRGAANASSAARRSRARAGAPSLAALRRRRRVEMETRRRTETIIGRGVVSAGRARRGRTPRPRAPSRGTRTPRMPPPRGGGGGGARRRRPRASSSGARRRVRAPRPRRFARAGASAPRPRGPRAPSSRALRTVAHRAGLRRPTPGKRPAAGRSSEPIASARRREQCGRPRGARGEAREMPTSNTSSERRAGAADVEIRHGTRRPLEPRFDRSRRVDESGTGISTERSVSNARTISRSKR